MIRRRMLMSNMYGYTEIAYLKSTGTQYIDTLYKPNQNTKIICTMKADEYSDSGRLFGCSSGTSWNSVPNYQMDYENGGSLGNFQVIIGNNTSWSSYSSYKGDYNKHTYIIDKGNAYRDGTLIHTNNAGDFQCTTNLAIYSQLRSNGITTSTGIFFKGKLYDFQIYENDVLVRDFVPVEVEGIGYLYDKVTKQLFANQGTGDFICGPKKADYNKVLMTSTTNPEVMAICYAQGWCYDASYMTYGEANEINDIGTVFSSSNITHFEEFEYFINCSALNSGAFNGCSSLENIILPSTVKSIGGNIFRNCTSLKTISGYDNITSITGESQFLSCSSLESFNWKWGSRIPQSCFQYCSSLLLDFNPNIINNVGAGALTNVSFTVTDFNLSLNQSILNDNTFASTNIKNITFWGSNFPTIYQYAFNGCRYLESISIPSSVSTIYQDAFRNCTNLKEIRCGGHNAPQLSLAAYDQANFPTNGVIKVPIGATGYDQGGWGYLVNNKGWTIVYQDIWPRKYNYTNQLAEFTRVEYLECDGNQWINLGFAPRSEMKLSIDVNGEPHNSFNGITTLFEALLNSSTGDNLLFRINTLFNEVTSTNFAKTHAWNYTGGITFGNVRHLYAIDKNGVYVDNTQVMTITNQVNNNFDNDYSNKLRALATWDGLQQVYGKVYSIKIEENGSTIMDLVPGRFGDSIGCMYDKISNKIFYSNGYQPFTCGPDLT